MSPEMFYRQVEFLVEERDWAGQGEEIELKYVKDEDDSDS